MRFLSIIRSPSGSAIKLLIFLSLLLAVGATTYAAKQYADTRKPLPAILPGASARILAYSPLYGGTITGISSPNSVAVSPDGARIYVAESEGERSVKVFDTTTFELIQELAPAGSSVVLRKPLYVAVNQEGRVFVSDGIRPAVHMYGPAGEYIGVYQPEEGENGWIPLALNFQANGNLAVTDISGDRHRVLSFLPNENLAIKIEQGPVDSNLSFPSSAVQDSAGHWYVADSNNSRLLICDSNGAAVGEIPATEARGGVAMPRGMAIDALGRLYVADASSNDVKVFQTGDKLQFLFAFGQGGLEDGQFRFPNGVAVDDRGRIWVADWGNNRVQMWQY